VENSEALESKIQEKTKSHPLRKIKPYPEPALKLEIPFLNENTGRGITFFVLFYRRRD
jgi:hypothetical protein